MSCEIIPTISEWQSEAREIGMLTFLPSSSVAKHFPYYSLPDNALFIGLMESDALCMMDDGSIQVYDHEVPDRVLSVASPNQEVFVAALAVLEEYFEKCVADESYYDDESAGIEVRERCAAIAGGDDYTGFFCGLVGL